MLRALVCFAGFGIVAISAAQNDHLFLKVRTDATVQIKVHRTGADLVEINMRDPNYPVDLLRKQVLAMCGDTGVPPRGLYVGKIPLPGADSQFAYVEATFATDGLVENDGGLRIEPIIKAFAGAPSPYTVSGLTLEFSGVRPTTQTMRRYEEPGVLQAEARFTDSGPLAGIEYRVALLSQDPSKIHFPDRYVPEKASAPAQILHPTSPNFLPLLLVFLVIGIGAGALVYFAMLRSGSKNRL